MSIMENSTSKVTARHTGRRLTQAHRSQPLRLGMKRLSDSVPETI